MFLLLGVLLCIGAGVNANLRSYLKEMELIPDVFDESDTIPDKILSLYNGDEKLINGKEYSPTFLLKMPTVEMNYDPNYYYALAFFSPDYISRDLQNYKNFIFWLKTNIRGNDINTGDTIIEYLTPAPLKSSGQGRGIVVLYKQPGKLTFDEPRVGQWKMDLRLSWSLKNFVSKYNLGNPEALFVGTTRWDESVPKLHQTIMTQG